GVMPRRPFGALAVRALILCAISFAYTPAQGQRAPTPADIRLSYAPIVARVAPAVVNVYAARAVDRNNAAIEEYFRRFFGPCFNVPQQQQRSLGSGVLVDASGLIVTNNHVIEGADQVKVSLSDKREFEADIVLKDARTDIAVLSLKGARERFP